MPDNQEPPNLPPLPPPDDNNGNEEEEITHIVNGVEVPDPSPPQATAQFATPASLPALPPPNIENLADEPPITEFEQLQMLKHMVFVPGFYNSSKDILDEIKYFSTNTDVAVGALADCIITVLKEYPNNLVSKYIIIDLYDKHLKEKVELNITVTVMQLLEDWYKETSFLDDSHILQDRLYALLKQHRKTTMLVQGVNKATEAFQESIESYNIALVNNPFTRVTRTNPFGSMETLISSVAETEKYPTHVWYFDDIMNDGAMLGEAIGVLAPPSGGKTTAAIQLAAAQVDRKIYIAHISTEQGIQGDLSARAMSLATGKARGYFEGGIGNWPEHEQIELLDKMKNYDEYYHFFDYTQTKPKNIEELLNPVEEMIKAGKKPVFVIIDWWGAIKDAMIVGALKHNNTQMTETEAGIRRNSRIWLDTITKKAKAMGVVPIIFHQVSGDAASKKGGSLLTGQDAQEDKQFENYFDFCLVFGPKDGDDNFKINPSKARRAANNYLWGHLNGAFCRIDRKKVMDQDMTQMNSFMAKHMEGNEDINEDMG